MSGSFRTEPRGPPDFWAVANCEVATQMAKKKKAEAIDKAAAPWSVVVYSCTAIASRVFVDMFQ